MKNFVFEWLSEELPFKVQTFLQREMERLFISELHKVAIDYSAIQVFTTPRRFAVIINELSCKEGKNDIKGPKQGSDDEIIAKFLQRIGKEKEDLYIKKVSGREYFFVKESKDLCLDSILKSVVESVLTKINWPKTMRWGRHLIKCNRPIISLLAMLNEKIIEVEFAHYKASNTTLGHRFLSSGVLLIVANADQYAQVLKENFVVLDHNERKELIRSRIIALCKEKELSLKIDSDLLDEVTALVELPNVAIASIEEFFIRSLPKELVKVVLKNHQRFFSCWYESGSMAPYFIAVSNVPVNTNILEGYEKVVYSRLSDANSLMEVDRKYIMTDIALKLREITLYSVLGNMEKKVNRVSTLAKYIAIWVRGASITQVETVALRCKDDLATSVVGEFPELEGIIGAYYYNLSSGDEEIAQAIKEHTYPVNASSPCSSHPVAIAVSIADKLDTLAGFIIGGESIDSNKDPFGLRRNAIGIVRTILENNLNIPLKLIIGKSITLFPQKVFSSKFSRGEECKLTRTATSERVLGYLWSRMSVMLKNDNIRIDFLKNSTCSYRLLELKNNAKFLKEFLLTREGENFISAYRRVSNIVNKSDADKLGHLNKKLLATDEEVALVEQIENLAPVVSKLYKKNNIIGVLANLTHLSSYIVNFMDKVVVNADDANQKANRLIILNKLKLLCNESVDFELILKNTNDSIV